MIAIKDFPAWRIITGRVMSTEVIDVMKLYMKGAGVVPPIFIDSGACDGSRGNWHFVVLNVALSDERLAELEALIENFEVEE